MEKTVEELKKELTISELNDVNGAGSWSREHAMGAIAEQVFGARGLINVDNEADA